MKMTPPRNLDVVLLLSSGQKSIGWHSGTRYHIKNWNGKNRPATKGEVAGFRFIGRAEVEHFD